MVQGSMVVIDSVCEHGCSSAGTVDILWICNGRKNFLNSGNWSKEENLHQKRSPGVNSMHQVVTFHIRLKRWR